jgi:hypothetical protein
VSKQASSPAGNLRQGDMSISITDPSADEVMGGSFAVQGNYSCPVGNPTFACDLAPAAPSVRGQMAPIKRILPLYLTSATSTWEAYFTGVAPGNYTVTGTISHPGDSKSTPAVPISVSAAPGVTVSCPAQGDSIPSGNYSAIGSVDPAYLSGYLVQASLTTNGITVAGPTLTTPDQSGNWSACLPIQDALEGDSNMNINVLLLVAGSTTVVSELAIGNLTIITPPR